jgi:glycosyltransferase involved in cell wall biosynthesis
MPTYNRAHLVVRSIDSVISQSYKNWELLIIDDGSTDGTREIVIEYSKKDERIKFINIPRTEFKGISKYLNLGIEKAKGKYIARIDDDDYWCHKDKLNYQVNFLESNKDYVLCGGGVQLVDINGKVLYKYFENHTDRDIRRNALKSNPFSHSSVLFRKEIAQTLGGYKELRYAEDWEIWLRFGKAGKLHNFNEYFVTYLHAGQNTSLLNQKDLAKNILKLIKSYRHDYPNYYIGFMLNSMQYLYSFMPIFFRKRVHTFLVYIKRKYF